MAEKFRCTICDSIFKLINAGKLKDLEGNEWRTCPVCKTPENMVQVCDVRECQQDVTCGTPTSDGYRLTCNEHQPKDHKQNAS